MNWNKLRYGLPVDVLCGSYIIADRWQRYFCKSFFKMLKMCMTKITKIY